MSEQHAQATDDGLGPVKWVILGLAILGIGGNWLLYNLAPPIGSRSIVGMVVGLLAGGYLLFLTYMYVN